MTTYTATATSISAAVLSIALLGDALIYVVLPVNAAEFGISLAWVGILLSANRIIRILTYGQVVRLTDAIGLKRMSILAAICGAGSTLLYWLGDSAAVLLFARIVWGLSFAAMSLITLAYAVDNRKRAGAHVGLSRAVIQIGPILSLTVGAWLAGILGAKAVFLYLGMISLAAIPIAFLLPAENRKRKPPKRPWFPKPGLFDLLFFVVGFGVDGVFNMTVALMLLNSGSIEAAMLGGGILLASRHLAEFFFAPLGGMLGDRVGMTRVLMSSVIVLAAGFVVIGAGSIYPGAALIIVARSVLAAVGPAAVATAAAEQHTMHRLAVLQTWRDFGAAIGPLVSGFLFAALGAATLYYSVVPLLVGVLALMAFRGRLTNGA